MYILVSIYIIPLFILNHYCMLLARKYYFAAEMRLKINGLKSVWIFLNLEISIAPIDFIFYLFLLIFTAINWFNYPVNDFLFVCLFFVYITASFVNISNCHLCFFAMSPNVYSNLCHRNNRIKLVNKENTLINNYMAKTKP